MPSTGVAMRDQVKAISADRIDGPYPGAVLTPDELHRIQHALRQLLAVQVAGIDSLR